MILMHSGLGLLIVPFFLVIYIERQMCCPCRVTACGVLAVRTSVERRKRAPSIRLSR